MGRTDGPDDARRDPRGVHRPADRGDDPEKLDGAGSRAVSARAPRCLSPAERRRRSAAGAAAALGERLPPVPARRHARAERRGGGRLHDRERVLRNGPLPVALHERRLSAAGDRDAAPQDGLPSREENAGDGRGRRHGARLRQPLSDGAFGRQPRRDGCGRLLRCGGRLVRQRPLFRDRRGAHPLPADDDRAHRVRIRAALHDAAPHPFARKTDGVRRRGARHGVRRAVRTAQPLRRPQGVARGGPRLPGRRVRTCGGSALPAAPRAQRGADRMDGVRRPDGARDDARRRRHRRGRAADRARRDVGALRRRLGAVRRLCGGDRDDGRGAARTRSGGDGDARHTQTVRRHLFLRRGRGDGADAARGVPPVAPLLGRTRIRRDGDIRADGAACRAPDRPLRCAAAPVQPAVPHRRTAQEAVRRASGGVLRPDADRGLERQDRLRRTDRTTTRRTRNARDPDLVLPGR